MAANVDKLGRMRPEVVVTISAEMLPFGVLRERRVIPVGPQSAEADRKPPEPILPEPTTLVDHIITSAPVRLVRA